MTYTGYDGVIARLCLAASQDLLEWEKRGPIIPIEMWEEHFSREEYQNLFPKHWSKSGAILQQPLDGFYWMYFGDSHIWLARTKNFQDWEILEPPVLSPRPDSFDALLVEPGPPPLIQPEGIWLGYNGADRDSRYSFGQALFDANHPEKLLRRSSQPMLEPVTPEERVGQAPNVVFGEGLVRLGEKWFLYYGMADTYLGVAISEEGSGK